MTWFDSMYITCSNGRWRHRVQGLTYASYVGIVLTIVLYQNRPDGLTATWGGSRAILLWVLFLESASWTLWSPSNSSHIDAAHNLTHSHTFIWLLLV